jgi:gliding motility-associated-like protein
MYTNQFGCDSLVITTLVPPPSSWYPNAAFQLTPGIVLYPENQTTVINFSNENLSHQWFFEGEFWSDTTGNFVISAPDIGSYVVTLVVSDTLNCTDTLVQYFQIIPDLLLHVPNAFTPNGDEFNQVFLPIFSDPTLVSDYQLLIFNRWNRIIFESNNQFVGWNGIYKERLVPNDTYTWIVTYTSKVTNERKEVIGHVSVIR